MTCGRMACSGVAPAGMAEPFAGRVLLDLEHGYGDSFMLLRWVPVVGARVGAPTIRARPELIPMIAGQCPDGYQAPLTW